MERRDIIKDEIERLGRVLGKVLAILLGTKGPDNVLYGIEKAEQTLQSELDIDINQLVQLSNEDLISKLVDELKFSNNKLEQLADIIFELGENKGIGSGIVQKLYFIKSLVLYEHLTNTSSTYSLGWIDKVNRVKKMIGT